VVISIQTFGDFLLLGKGKITEEVVKLIMSWRHSGFIRGGQVLNHLGLWELTPPHFRRVKPWPVCVHRTGRRRQVFPCALERRASPIRENKSIIPTPRLGPWTLARDGVPREGKSSTLTKARAFSPLRSQRTIPVRTGFVHANPLRLNMMRPFLS
jgi:hypothetical protein